MLKLLFKLLLSPMSLVWPFIVNCKNYCFGKFCWPIRPALLTHSLYSSFVGIIEVFKWTCLNNWCIEFYLEKYAIARLDIWRWLVMLVFKVPTRTWRARPATSQSILINSALPVKTLLQKLFFGGHKLGDENIFCTWWIWACPLLYQVWFQTKK